MIVARLRQADHLPRPDGRHGFMVARIPVVVVGKVVEAVAVGHGPGASVHFEFAVGKPADGLAGFPVGDIEVDAFILASYQVAVGCLDEAFLPIDGHVKESRPGYHLRFFRELPVHVVEDFQLLGLDEFLSAFLGPLVVGGERSPGEKQESGGHGSQCEAGDFIHSWAPRNRF